jgi:hypothetical protein
MSDSSDFLASPEPSPSPATIAAAPPSLASDEYMLIDWLRDRNTSCPLCQYNLRGLKTPRCPECGQALQLSVSLAEPYLKAWIALVAALLPPAGIGSIFIFGFCYALYREGFRVLSNIHFSNFEIGPTFALAHLVSCVPLSVLAIAFRRRILCWSKRIQLGLAGAAWTAVAVSSLILLAQVF